ncbi:glycosyltransferase family 39 protein [Patescibacteria group bacterium]|nr:glycosyltransferase family 39 protein [Patescibacteria group bacterium]MBU1890855.1 glycosyltransferase family 39 protein [Patescibacteria group bacterium]
MYRITIESILLVLGVITAILIALFVGLGLFGQFSNNIMLTIWVIIVILLLYWLVANRKKLIFDIRRQGVAILVLVILFCVFSGYFHHDIPRGRDDMAYISAAAKISESGSLSFEDIISRPYHPFRSIEGDEFTSQFLPGYSVFLASFYSFGGLTGLQVGNTLLLFLTLISIYFIVKNLTNNKTAFITVVLYSTLYTTLWFSRRTNSENLLIALLLLSGWLIIRGLKKKQAGYFAISAFVASLTILVRGEGLVYAGLGLLLNLFFTLKYWPRTWRMALATIIFFIAAVISGLLLLQYGRIFGGDYIEYALVNMTSALSYLWRFKLVFLGIAVFTIAGLWLRRAFRLAQKPILLRPYIISGVVAIFLLAELAVWLYSQNNDIVRWRYYKIQYVINNLWAYMLFPYFAVICWGFLKNAFRKEIFIITLLFIPSFIFLIEPSIAVDQPWFMRRFYGGFIPIMIIFAGIAIGKIIEGKKYAFNLIILLLVLNMSVSLPLLFFKDNNGVGKDLDEFAQKYTKDDLIILEPGWHWQQWGYAWHYLNDLTVLPNVDGFTVEEFTKLVNDYQNVYIVSSQKDDPYILFDQSDLEYLYDYSLRYQKLIPTAWANDYVEDNKDDLSLATLKRAWSGTPPRTFEDVRQTLYVFRLKQKNILTDRFSQIPNY